MEYNVTDYVCDISRNYHRKVKNVCFHSSMFLFWSYIERSHTVKKSIIILKTLMKAMHRQDIFLFNLLEVVIRLVVYVGRKKRKFVS